MQIKAMSLASVRAASFSCRDFLEDPITYATNLQVGSSGPGHQALRGG